MDLDYGLGLQFDWVWVWVWAPIMDQDYDPTQQPSEKPKQRNHMVYPNSSDFLLLPSFEECFPKSTKEQR